MGLKSLGNKEPILGDGSSPYIDLRGGLQERLFCRHANQLLRPGCEVFLFGMGVRSGRGPGFELA
jgi:hypothetical protein